MSVRPARVVHRGRVRASALLVDPRRIGPDEARARVLALLRPGARVVALDGAWLVLLPEPVEVVEPYPATPLVASGRTSSAPLAPDEAALAPAWSVATGGELRRVDPDAAPVVDPSTWLALDLPVLEGTPVGRPPPPPTAALAPIALAPGALGVELLPESTEVARALATASGDLGLGARLLLRVAAFVGSLRRAPPASELPAAPPGPIGQGLVWFERWLSGLAERLGLHQLLGERQARYLAELLRLLEGDDLLAALKRAIPLGGTGAGESFRGWGLPSPRSDLELDLRRRVGGGPSIAGGPDLYGRLKALYRQAAERLERDGRIREAAFVLDTLLGDATGAVDLLERHEEAALAARLAEARGLAPGLLVRLWFLAGDEVRAVLLARQHRAFADAVARLGRQPDAQRRLRSAWARDLARAGRWLAAVDALAERGPEAVEWMEQAIAERGRAGATLLPRRLELDPEALARLAPIAAELARDPEAGPALLEALDRAPTTPAQAALAAPALRSALRSGLSAAKIGPVARRHGDVFLAADLPHDPQAAPAVPTLRTLGRADAGGLALLDAVPLEGGEWLVALGELGAARVDRRGRVRRRWEWPTRAIVATPGQNRALLVGGAGELRRIAKLAPHQDQLEPWVDARIGCWSESFDGDTWVVADGEDVLAADVLAPEWRALWWSRGLGARILAVRADEAEVDAVLAPPVGQLWRWDRAGFVLRERRPIEQPGALGEVVVGGRDRMVSFGFSLEGRGPCWRTLGAFTQGELVSASFAAWGPVTAARRAQGVAVTLGPAGDLLLGGASVARVRAEGHHAWVCDDLGRIVSSNGADLRVHL